MFLQVSVNLLGGGYGPLWRQRPLNAEPPPHPLWTVRNVYFV